MTSVCPQCLRRYEGSEFVCTEDESELLVLGVGDPRIGTIVSDRYLLTTVIGHGGMGVVYRAYQLAMGRNVALKTLMPGAARDAMLRKRFIREARATAALKSPHTVTVFDFGELSDGALYLVMELLDGTALDEMVSTKGPLPLTTVRTVGMHVCKSLSEAHRAGLVHRDLKPSNLMLERETTGALHTKVLDFGIVKLVDDGSTRLTATNAAVGSIAYMSPEQIDGKAVGPAADIYSLGCTLFDIAADRLPFDAETKVALMFKHLSAKPPVLSEVIADTPSSRALGAVITRCLAKAPDARYASTDELYLALEALTLTDNDPASYRRSPAGIDTAGDVTVPGSPATQPGRPASRPGGEDTLDPAAVPSTAPQSHTTHQVAAPSIGRAAPVTETAKTLGSTPPQRSRSSMLRWLFVAASVLLGSYLLVETLTGDDGSSTPDMAATTPQPQGEASTLQPDAGPLGVEDAKSPPIKAGTATSSDIRVATGKTSDTAKLAAPEAPSARTSATGTDEPPATSARVIESPVVTASTAPDVAPSTVKAPVGAPSTIRAPVVVGASPSAAAATRPPTTAPKTVKRKTSSSRVSVRASADFSSRGKQAAKSFGVRLKSCYRKSSLGKAGKDLQAHALVKSDGAVTRIGSRPKDAAFDACAKQLLSRAGLPALKSGSRGTLTYSFRR